MRVNTAPPLISAHRLARLTTWARLWLEWFLAVALVQCGVRLARERIGFMRRVAARLILYHAIARCGRPKARVNGARRLLMRRGRGSAARAYVGAVLRRALRGRGSADTVVRLIAVLRDPETFIRRLIVRLAQTFTRLFSTPVEALTHDADPRSIFCAHALTDTS